MVGYSYGTGRSDSEDDKPNRYPNGETHRPGMSLKSLILTTVLVMIVLAVLMLLSDGSEPRSNTAPPARTSDTVIMAQPRAGGVLPSPVPFVRHPIVTN